MRVCHALVHIVGPPPPPPFIKHGPADPKARFDPKAAWRQYPLSHLLHLQQAYELEVYLMGCLGLFFLDQSVYSDLCDLFNGRW